MNLNNSFLKQNQQKISSIRMYDILVNKIGLIVVHIEMNRN